MSNSKVGKDWVVWTCLVSPESDELVRAKARHKGDKSILTDEALKQTYKPKATLPDNPTAT